MNVANVQGDNNQTLQAQGGIHQTKQDTIHAAGPVNTGAGNQTVTGRDAVDGGSKVDNSSTTSNYYLLFATATIGALSLGALYMWGSGKANTSVQPGTGGAGGSGSAGGGGGSLWSKLFGG